MRMLAVGTLLPLLALSVPFICVAVPGDQLVSLDTPGQHPTGLCYDGDHLWLADRFTDTLYAVNPQTGETAREIPAPSFVPRGLAWDGEHLWCVDGEENQICKLDVRDGITIRSIDCPTPKPQGLTWDGEYLWLCDNREDVIAKISIEDGTTVVSFAAPGLSPQGLTWDGRYLWCSDRMLDRIYMVHPEHGEVLLSIDSPGQHPRGLAWQDDSLWNADYQEDKIYKVATDDATQLKTSDPRRERLLFIHEFRNHGPGDVKILDVYIALPSDRPNQRLLGEVVFDPAPTGFVTDRWGQRFAHYRRTDLPLAERNLITMTADVELMDARWFVFPERVGALDDIPEEIREKYLADEDKYRIHDPVIQEAIQEAVGEERNPYWIMQKVYRYLHEKLYYELVGGWNVAPAILTRGNGSCSEYSFVFIAMCRAAGLPTRYVGSVAVRGDDASTDYVFHRWCECYLPGYGWVPVDPSGGDRDIPADVADYFGHVQNRFLITTEGGGASRYIGWNYNADQTWTSKGPVKVHVEKLGEWSPLEAPVEDVEQR
jgi:transglutaminase-like putative cysteine protease